MDCLSGMYFDLKDLRVGDEVFYKDIDDNISTGYYIIQKFITDEIVLLSNDNGTEFEAFITELS